MEEQDFTQPTHEELQLIADYGGYDATYLDASAAATASGNAYVGMDVTDDDISFSVDHLIQNLTQTVVNDGPDAFVDFAESNHGQIVEASRWDSRVADVLLACYKYGIKQRSGSCANSLGTLYYIGEIFEQDYQNAATLYELGMDLGCYQSIINLGYICEYGRIGERDFKKAYEYYSLAAALDPSSEAIYKLGDMYARGEFVEPDMSKARILWEHSLEIADDIEDAAQASARIAPLLIDYEGDNGGAPFDPLRALGLYQQAEMGLRISIAGGEVYYRPRLQEVIEGQAKARALMK